MEPEPNRPSPDDVGALLESITVEKTRRAMKEMMQLMIENQAKTDKRFVELSDFCKELDQRLREQERYSSKDSIIINNPPDNPRDDEKLISNTINFFKTFLNIELDGASFKACHLLPGKKQLPYGLMPAVIVKFVYFAEKNQVYSQRKLLKEKKNPLNGKNIYINERLPPIESMLKSWADHRNYVTTTRNCTVSVLCDDGKGAKKFVSVSCEKDIESLENPVKRNTAADIPRRSNNPFKRNFIDIQDNGEKLAKAYASLSPEQKKAFKDAVM